MSKHNRERKQIKLRMKLEGKTRKDLTPYGRARISQGGKKLLHKMERYARQ